MDAGVVLLASGVAAAVGVVAAYGLGFRRGVRSSHEMLMHAARTGASLPVYGEPHLLVSENEARLGLVSPERIQAHHVAAVKAWLDRMDSGFWSRGGQSMEDLVRTVVKAVREAER